MSTHIIDSVSTIQASVSRRIRPPRCEKTDLVVTAHAKGFPNSAIADRQMYAHIRYVWSVSTALRRVHVSGISSATYKLVLTRYRRPAVQRAAVVSPDYASALRGYSGNGDSRRPSATACRYANCAGSNAPSGRASSHTSWTDMVLQHKPRARTESVRYSRYGDVDADEACASGRANVWGPCGRHGGGGGGG